LNGTVTIAGTVRSWAEHDEAIDAAWAAPGVTLVRDDMVRPPLGVTASSRERHDSATKVTGSSMSLRAPLIVRGVLAIVVGIVSVAWPNITIGAFVIVFAVYASHLSSPPPRASPRSRGPR
jgi:hypothetical protein